MEAKRDGVVPTEPQVPPQPVDADRPEDVSLPPSEPQRGYDGDFLPMGL